MDKLVSILKAVGGLADAAVPVAHGDRTSIMALLAVFNTQVLPAIVPLIPPPYGVAVAALIPVINQLATVLIPMFAAAHVARSLPEPVKKAA